MEDFEGHDLIEVPEDQDTNDMTWLFPQKGPGKFKDMAGKKKKKGGKKKKKESSPEDGSSCGPAGLLRQHSVHRRPRRHRLEREHPL